MKFIGIIKWSAIVVVLLILLSALLIFSLPAIISSSWFLNVFVDQLDETLNVKADIGGIEWSEFDKIRLHSLRLHDNPLFSDSPLFSVKELAVNISLSDLLKKRLLFNIFIDSPDFRLIRTKDGNTNIESFISEISGREGVADGIKAESKERGDFYFAVPLKAVSAEIDIRNISLKVEDHITEKEILLKEGKFLFRAPSLFNNPLTIETSGNIDIAGESLLPFDVGVDFAGFFDSQGVLTPDDGVINIRSGLPGVELSLMGDISQTAISTKLNLELDRLIVAVQKLLHPYTGDINVTGILEIETDIQGDPKGNVEFLFDIEGEDIRISGHLLNGRSIGGIDFEIAQKGALDLSREVLTIDSGRVSFSGNNSVSFKGGIHNFITGTGTFDVNVKTLLPNLNEIVDIFSDFLPREIIEMTSGDSPSLDIDDIALSGDLQSGKGRVALEGVEFIVPDIKQPANGALFYVNGVSFRIEETDILIQDFFPAEISLKGAASVRKAGVEGGRDTEISGLHIREIEFSAEGIGVSENALFGLTANMDIKESLSIEKVVLSPDITISDIDHSLDLGIDLSTTSATGIAFRDFLFSLSSIESDVANINDIRMKAGNGEISVTSLEPPRGDLKGIQTEIFVDDFISANVELSAKDLGYEGIDLHTTAQLDLNRLSGFLPNPGLPEGLYPGKADISFRAAGRIPDSNEVDYIMEIIESRRMIDKELAFLENLTLSIDLHDFLVDRFVYDTYELRAGNFSTVKPLRITFDNSGMSSTFQGEFFLEDFYESRFMSKPISMNLALSGQLEDMNLFSLSESLSIAPLNVNQSLSFSLSGIGDVFTSISDFTPSAIINRVNCRLDNSFVFGDNGDLSVFTNDVTVNGKMAVSTALKLNAKKNMTAALSVNSSKLDVKYKYLVKLQGLKTNIDLSRSFDILSRGDLADVIAVKPTLTKNVLIADRLESFSSEEGDRAINRLAMDLKGRFGEVNTLSFDSAFVKAMGLEVELSNQVLDFGFHDSLPSIDYFQIDILGGTLISSFAVVERNADLFIELKGAFSGLNGESMIKTDSPDSGKEDSEISGRFSLMLPVTEDYEFLLRSMDISLDITKIGKRSLERLLYSFDPYESNELIVKQRKLLRTGTPVRISLAVKNGNLSVNGEVLAKGVTIALPPVDRVNIADISDFKSLYESITIIDTVNKILQYFPADTIVTEDDGGLTLERMKSR